MTVGDVVRMIEAEDHWGISQVVEVGWYLRLHRILAWVRLFASLQPQFCFNLSSRTSDKELWNWIEYHWVYDNYAFGANANYQLLSQHSFIRPISTQFVLSLKPLLHSYLLSLGALNGGLFLATASSPTFSAAHSLASGLNVCTFQFFSFHLYHSLSYPAGDSTNDSFISPYIWTSHSPT